MKTCRVCGEVKPLDAFCVDKRKKTGRAGRCRECHREMNRKWREENPDYFRRYYSENREAVQAQKKAAQAADPETYRAQRAEWYRRNPEPARARTRAWYRSHQAKARAYVREWHKANPDKVRAYGRKSENKRRARKMALPAEDVDPQVVFERDGGICGICGESVDPSAWHLDHVIPLAQGGSHTYANVQTAHPTCNIRKGGRGERLGEFK